MGLTERHWFEDEEPELTENQLEDILWENNKIFERGYQKGFSDGKSALLREQAAMKPTPVAVDVDAEPYWKATCGGCKEPISLFAAPIIEVMNFARYCPHCGRPLNWLPHHKGDEK